MARYLFGSKTRRFVMRRKWPLLILVVLIVSVLAGVALVGQAYKRGLEPVSLNQTNKIFTVKKGASVKQIAANLEEAKLIRSAWAFELYVHKQGVTDKLQAGTYAFAPNDGPRVIVAIMSKGRVSDQLVTILPGRRIDQVRADLINAGFTPEDVDQALNPAKYADLPVLAYKPADVNTLEGLLWPDSWYKDATSSASDIIRQSLTAMNDHLTKDIQDGFTVQGLSVYQGIILSSVVLQEVNKPADQTQAAQVFLSRLHSGIVLGSDATGKYGAVLAGQAPNLTYDSAYNTHNHKGLPPTPISTVNDTSLSAVAHPAGTNWLYFVTGDDGTTYFSTNLQDHEAYTHKYCHKLCGN